MYTGYKTRFPSVPRDKTSTTSGYGSGIRAYLSRLVGPALAGVRSGPRNA